MLINKWRDAIRGAAHLALELGELRMDDLRCEDDVVDGQVWKRVARGRKRTTAVHVDTQMRSDLEAPAPFCHRQ